VSHSLESFGRGARGKKAVTIKRDARTEELDREEVKGDGEGKQNLVRQGE